MIRNKRQYPLFTAFALLLVFTVPLVARPQNPRNTSPRELNNRTAININVEMALVNVTVADRQGHTVDGLDKQNFKIYEDGVEQKISAFSSEDVPISIGVLFDVSGSMANKIDRARGAAIEFLRAANPRDEFFLVSFNDHAELTSQFTPSIEELQSRIMFASPEGRTALFDAIYLGLSQMRAAKNSKRALLIISDGVDNHSRYSDNDVRNFLREADCQLYAIGIFDINHMGRKSQARYGWMLLSELTEMTGGRVFPVASLSDLPRVASTIGMELRSQYVLGYKPSDTRHNGNWRKIKLKLKCEGQPHLKAYAKAGYYAPVE